MKENEGVKEYKMLDEDSAIGEVGYRETSYGKTECKVEESLLHGKKIKVFRPLKVKDVRYTIVREGKMGR